jgi:hypothetical protein
MELAGLPKGVDDIGDFGASAEGADANGLARGFVDVDWSLGGPPKGDAKPVEFGWLAIGRLC